MIVRTIPALRRALDSFRVRKPAAGGMATMGALHDAYVSPARLAKCRTAEVMVPILVNPIRFAPSGNLGSVRAIIFGGLVALASTGFGHAQTPPRPAAGGIGSPPDAMIFYVARGPAGTCGPGCSEWIAAEGTVQWDTHKRLIAILDRQSGRKLPVIIHSWGKSNLNVAISLGRILRDRGIDTTAGSTEVEACNEKSDAECFALKRPGGPLGARLKPASETCDLACVLILAGGVHRSLPAGAKVILGGMSIYNRLAPNVSNEEREGSTARFGELFRIYARDMGFDPELFDIVDRNSEARRRTEMPPSEWIRLKIVN